MGYVNSTDYEQRVYAGVLGKILGVYMGRPVEGWPYDDIRMHFDSIRRFPSKSLGLPLIVADDDISLSFVIARILGESKINYETAAKIWLNNIIENQTVLWWGGYGRATEHTALINLKRGILPPKSGSSDTNGDVLPVQVGAQIFNDAVTLAFPLDPEKAARVSNITSSVSHDGIALDITRFLARIRSQAFAGSNILDLIHQFHGAIEYPLVQEVVGRVIGLFENKVSWMTAREIINTKYGYATQRGGAPALSNFAMTMLALVFGEDDFMKSLEIACTAGLDTDSNAGVVGMINGVRLGLTEIDNTPLREEVADRMLVVSAKGGECVTDAVRETKKIVSAAKRLHGEQTEHQEDAYTFDFPGSVQGFTSCKYSGLEDTQVVNVGGAISFSAMDEAAVSTPTFLDYADLSKNFATYASPTLYPGDRVEIWLSGDCEATLFALYQTPDGVVGRENLLGNLGDKKIYEWEIPAVGNACPFRLGLRIRRGSATIHRINWSGAPKRFEFSGRLQQDIWDLQPIELGLWVHESDTFEADFASTFALGKASGHAFASIGTDKWENYSVSALLAPSHRAACGLLIGYQGRSDYDFAVVAGNVFELRSKVGETSVLLAQTILDEPVTEPFEMTLTMRGNRLEASITSRNQVMSTITALSEHRNGGAGVVVENGTCGVEKFVIKSEDN